MKISNVDQLREKIEEFNSEKERLLNSEIERQADTLLEWIHKTSENQRIRAYNRFHQLYSTLLSFLMGVFATIVITWIYQKFPQYETILIILAFIFFIIIFWLYLKLILTERKWLKLLDPNISESIDKESLKKILAEELKKNHPEFN